MSDDDPKWREHLARMENADQATTDALARLFKAYDRFDAAFPGAKDDDERLRLELELKEAERQFDEALAAGVFELGDAYMSAQIDARRKRGQVPLDDDKGGKGPH